MEYTMDYVDELGPHDEPVEVDGAKVVIAPMAQMFLFGTEIDYETSLLESGFKFNNPNVSDLRQGTLRRPRHPDHPQDDGRAMSLL